MRRHIPLRQLAKPLETPNTMCAHNYMWVCVCTCTVPSQHSHSAPTPRISTFLRASPTHRGKAAGYDGGERTVTMGKLGKDECYNCAHLTLPTRSVLESPFQCYTFLHVGTGAHLAPPPDPDPVWWKEFSFGLTTARHSSDTLRLSSAR